MAMMTPAGQAGLPASKGWPQPPPHSLEHQPTGAPPSLQCNTDTLDVWKPPQGKPPAPTSSPSRPAPPPPQPPPPLLPPPWSAPTRHAVEFHALLTQGHPPATTADPLDICNTMMLAPIRTRAWQDEPRDVGDNSPDALPLDPGSHRTQDDPAYFNGPTFSCMSFLLHDLTSDIQSDVELPPYLMRESFVGEVTSTITPLPTHDQHAHHHDHHNNNHGPPPHPQQQPQNCWPAQQATQLPYAPPPQHQNHYQKHARTPQDHHLSFMIRAPQPATHHATPSPPIPSPQQYNQQHHMQPQAPIEGAGYHTLSLNNCPPLQPFLSTTQEPSTHGCQHPAAPHTIPNPADVEATIRAVQEQYNLVPPLRSSAAAAAAASPPLPPPPTIGMRPPRVPSSTHLQYMHAGASPASNSPHMSGFGLHPSAWTPPSHGTHPSGDHHVYHHTPTRGNSWPNSKGSGSGVSEGHHVHSGGSSESEYLQHNDLRQTAPCTPESSRLDEVLRLLQGNHSRMTSLENSQRQQAVKKLAEAGAYRMHEQGDNMYVYKLRSVLAESLIHAHVKEDRGAACTLPTELSQAVGQVETIICTLAHSATLQTSYMSALRRIQRSRFPILEGFFLTVGQLHAAMDVANSVAGAGVGVYVIVNHAEGGAFSSKFGGVDSTEQQLLERAGEVEVAVRVQLLGSSEPWQVQAHPTSLESLLQAMALSCSPDSSWIQLLDSMPTPSGLPVPRPLMAAALASAIRACLAQGTLGPEVQTMPTLYSSDTDKLDQDSPNYEVLRLALGDGATFCPGVGAAAVSVSESDGACYYDGPLRTEEIKRLPARALGPALLLPLASRILSSAGDWMAVCPGVNSENLIVSGLLTSTPQHVEDVLMGSVNLLVAGEAKLWEVLVDGKSFSDELLDKDASSHRANKVLIKQEFATFSDSGVRSVSILQQAGTTVVTLPGHTWHHTTSAGCSMAIALNWGHPPLESTREFIQNARRKKVGAPWVAAAKKLDQAHLFGLFYTPEPQDMHPGQQNVGRVGGHLEDDVEWMWRPSKKTKRQMAREERVLMVVGGAIRAAGAAAHPAAAGQQQEEWQQQHQHQQMALQQAGSVEDRVPAAVPNGGVMKKKRGRPPKVKGVTAGATLAVASAPAAAGTSPAAAAWAAAAKGAAVVAASPAQLAAAAANAVPQRSPSPAEHQPSPTRATPSPLAVAPMDRTGSITLPWNVSGSSSPVAQPRGQPGPTHKPGMSILRAASLSAANRPSARRIHSPVNLQPSQPATAAPPQQPGAPSADAPNRPHTSPSPPFVPKALLPTTSSAAHQPGLLKRMLLLPNWPGQAQKPQKPSQPAQHLQAAQQPAQEGQHLVLLKHGLEKMLDCMIQGTAPEIDILSIKAPRKRTPNFQLSPTALRPALPPAPTAAAKLPASARQLNPTSPVMPQATKPPAQTLAAAQATKPTAPTSGVPLATKPAAATPSPPPAEPNKPAAPAPSPAPQPNKRPADTSPDAASQPPVKRGPGRPRKHPLPGTPIPAPPASATPQPGVTAPSMPNTNITAAAAAVTQSPVPDLVQTANVPTRHMPGAAQASAPPQPPSQTDAFVPKKLRREAYMLAREAGRMNRDTDIRWNNGRTTRPRRMSATSIPAPDEEAEDDTLPVPPRAVFVEACEPPSSHLPRSEPGHGRGRGRGRGRGGRGPGRVPHVSRRPPHPSDPPSPTSVDATGHTTTPAPKRRGRPPKNKPLPLARATTTAGAPAAVPAATLMPLHVGGPNARARDLAARMVVRARSVMFSQLTQTTECRGAAGMDTAESNWRK